MALALTVTVPLIVPPAAGAVMDAVGGAALLTVSLTALEVAVFPAVSTARVVMVCAPFATLAEFQDIVPDTRIVFVYRMAAGDMPLSVSLTTIELAPWQGGTQLTFTEQGAFFAGPESARGREEGCRFLMDKLAAELAGQDALPA